MADWAKDDVVTLRRAYDADRLPLAATAPREVEITVEERLGLKGLRFTPPSELEKAPILYFHGGGWMVGSPDTHRALCAWLSFLTGRVVVSASYPLAPEHDWPAQRIAARAALEAVRDVEGRPMFVAGDSAGGAMALWAAADNTRHVAGIAAFYPAFGVTSSPSIDAFGPESLSLSRDAIGLMYKRLGAATDDVQSAVPNKGAPTLILAAGKDPLFDDSSALARYIIERDVTHWVAEAEGHGFLHEAGTRDEVQLWLRDVALWMDAKSEPSP